MTLLNFILPFIICSWLACRQVLLGSAIGVFLLSVFSQLRLNIGADANSTIAILIVVSLGFLFASWLISSRWVSKPQTVFFCLAAFWTILNPSLIQNLQHLLSRLPLETVTAPGISFCLTLLTCLCSLGPPVVAAFVLLFSKREEFSDELQADFLVGISLSWFIVPTAMVAWLGMSGCVLLSAVSGCASLLTPRLVFMKTSSSKSSNAAAILERSSVTLIVDSLVCLFCGVGFALALHVAQLLLARSLIIEISLWSGVCLGIVTAWCINKYQVSQKKLTSGGGLILACWASLLLISFPFMTDAALSISAWVSQTWMIFGLRIGLTLLLTVPLGYCLGQLIFCQSFSTQHESGATSSLLFTMGLTIALWSQQSLMVLAPLLCCCGLALWTARWALQRGSLPETLWLRTGLVASGVVAIAGLFCTTRYTPELTERVLFSGQAFAALRGGVDSHQLPWMDDSQLRAEFETVQGRWSVWNYRSAQFVIKHNGLTTDYISSSPEVCPQVVSEVCPALMPLILHPAAEDVLVIGFHGSTLKTCAEFPLRSITTLEPDEQARKVVNFLTEKKILSKNSQQAFVYGNLRQTLASRHAVNYDIIVCPSPLLMETDGAAQLSTEFYTAVARHLSEDGVFSQRVPYYDLGPEVLQRITKSMQSAFPQVMMTEPVAGEIVFLATKQSANLIDEQVVERLQYPQAVRVLSQMGWDWSVPLSRGALSPESLLEFTAETSQSQHQDSTLAFTLPVEISRWGNKSQLSRAALSQYGKTLGTFMGDIPESKEVSERLEDLRLAQKVLTEHPDQFWAYRSVLKKQLKDRPRAKVINVKHEGVKRALHPEDQRRKDYLIALGKAATQAHPALSDIEEVRQFADNLDFDPLVNYFVHHEVALLCERAEEPVPNLELFHRLHAIYFSPAQEKSVRDVCRTIRLLTEEQNLSLTDQQRWDHLSGLLEVMKQRWRVRIADSKHASTYEPVDTEKSVEAIEMAIETLDKLRDETLVSQENWNARKDLLDDHLLRPLRRHRSHQLNSYAIAPPE